MSATQVVPVSDLRTNHREVFALLRRGPVILAQHSKASAVLLSVSEWDRMNADLKRLRRSALADEIYQEMKSGKYLTQEQLDQELGAVQGR